MLAGECHVTSDRRPIVPSWLSGPVVALFVGFSVSIGGVLIGGQTGTLLLAFSGNLLTIVGVYIATGRKRRAEGP